MLIPLRLPAHHLQPLRICLEAEDELVRSPDRVRCGAGWFPLLTTAGHKIRAARPGVVLVAGRRHGVLTLSIRNPKTYDKTIAWERISEPIREAEEQSADICEFCGRPGQLRTEVYFYTACDGCQSKQPQGGWVPR